MGVILKDAHLAAATKLFHNQPLVNLSLASDTFECVSVPSQYALSFRTFRTIIVIVHYDDDVSNRLRDRRCATRSPDDRRVASGRRGESRPTKCAQTLSVLKFSENGLPTSHRDHPVLSATDERSAARVRRGMRNGGQETARQNDASLR
ncbi:hypothetical protein ALC62_00978 [Cyphomyrmex costatus]|uniref:Uncharacterized protein n=1 Tax=Cyphomyrmex costatus TaxID=456900 RepID=A0A195D5I1_9HYME|nr:hypothetical protein ALC62_00978 [Cyphomyrmex costatus]